MTSFSAETKHSILLEYSARSNNHTFIALARRHGVKGGERTIRGWYQRWNGTPQSLEDKQRSGRPRILTPVEVSRHIRAPILAANRAHRAIHYPDMWKSVQTKTGKKIALRTLQQYGKDQYKIKEKTTRKRTQAECKYKHAQQIENTFVLHVCDADQLLQCLLIPVNRSQPCDASYNESAEIAYYSLMKLHYASMLHQRAHSSSLVNNHTS
jgi:hypothetical protein